MFLGYPVGLLGMGSGHYGSRRWSDDVFDQPFEVLNRGGQQELVAGSGYATKALGQGTQPQYSWRGRVGARDGSSLRTVGINLTMQGRAFAAMTMSSFWYSLRRAVQSLQAFSLLVTPTF